MTFAAWLQAYDPTGFVLDDRMIAIAMAAYDTGFDTGFDAGVEYDPAYEAVAAYDAGVEAESSHQQDMPKEEGL